MTYNQRSILYIVIGVLIFASLVVLVRADSNRTFFRSAASGDGGIVAVDVPAGEETSSDNGTGTSSQSGATNGTEPSPSPKSSSPRLRIPSIGVNAAIENVGTTLQGKMDIPIRLADVGWYDKGTAIGAVGSAVIDGHVDDVFGLPAVFYKLEQVKRGDDVYITTQKGSELHFEVTEVNDYSVSAAPLEEIFNDTSGERLIRLITCKGSWDAGKYSYDHRTIVTAKLVS